MAASETASSNLVAALAHYDEISRSARADRIQWLSEHQIPLGVVVGPMDTMAVLGEARDCFIAGHYIAALLLAVAFIEHTVADELNERDLAKYGVPFVEAIKIAQECSLFPIEMLSRADRLRKIRNPFMHRKDVDHEHSFGNRFLKSRVHPNITLEEDAKDALALMYAFFYATLK
jgi:hypothetical protein